MNLVKVVGAMNEEELKGIFIFSRKQHNLVIVDVHTIRMLRNECFRDKLWIAQYPEIVDAVEKEIQEGPFEFIVLFLRD
ncbi:MAG: hypothetical protein V1851_02100 [Patescibacteria group bacterium]